jgi:hypothetical protein
MNGITIKHKYLLLIALLFFCFTSARAQTSAAQMDSILYTMPDVKVIAKKESKNPYQLYYQLAVKQPVDHTNPRKGYFYQQVLLLHRDFAKPMVMQTEGYTGGISDSNEPEAILYGNSLNVEFRYFNKSKPSPLQWQYLTFEQAVADLHHIKQLFGKLYPAKWLSTGISRGGETALIYKYYYPADIDAVVAYVAPMPNDIEDKRVYTFLDTAGGATCVKKMRDLQIFLLQHEKEALAKLPETDKYLPYKTLGGIGPAFEYCVMEYTFAFWQTTMLGINDIPDNHNVDDYLKHLLNVLGGMSLFSDVGIKEYLPHEYMTYQTGYYKYNIKPFKPYLHYLKGANPSAAVLPPTLPRKPYNPEFERKIIAWLKDKGDNILYIYGGRDTWTACKAEIGDAKAVRYIIPGANHYTARVKNMPLQMQLEFADAFEKATGLKANMMLLK